MNQNKLTVYCGPMFSRKSGELLNAADRAGCAKEKTIAFIPHKDTRSECYIKSRAFNNPCPAIQIQNAYETIQHIENKIASEDRPIKSVTLLFDEAQFFHRDLIAIIKKLLSNELFPEIKKTIFVAGLDLDAWRKTFKDEVIPVLMALADNVHKLTAICFKCGEPAIFTQKIGGSSNQIEIGDREIYEARCRSCHTIPA